MQTEPVRGGDGEEDCRTVRVAAGRRRWHGDGGSGGAGERQPGPREAQRLEAGGGVLLVLVVVVVIIRFFIFFWS